MCLCERGGVGGAGGRDTGRQRGSSEREEKKEARAEEIRGHEKKM